MKLKKTRSHLLAPFSSPAILGFIFIASFQNCAKFNVDENEMMSLSASGPFPSESGKATASASYLPLNVFSSAGTLAIPLDTDVTPYLRSGTLENLQPGNSLSDGHFSIDLDDAYPNEIVAPMDNLVFSGSDPRFALGLLLQLAQVGRLMAFQFKVKSACGSERVPSVHLWSSFL